jgi:hypothetical protein
MPLVDMVIRFGVAKASRFGLLQHPITLTSQMATSAPYRKMTGRVWSKLLSVFVTRESAFQQPRQIFFSLAVIRASSAVIGSVNGGRDASLSMDAGFAVLGGDAAS